MRLPPLPRGSLHGPGGKNRRRGAVARPPRAGVFSPRRRPARCSVAPLGAAAGFADGGGCPAASAAVVVWGSRAPARACYIPFITLTYHLHIILILHS